MDLAMLGRIVALGCGGGHPCVEVRDMATGSVQPVDELAARHSGYALCRLGTLLLYGTRGGRVVLVRDILKALDGSPDLTVLRETGGQGLSAALSKGHEAVLSDTRSVTLWPQPEKDSQYTIQLQTCGERFCAIAFGEGVIHGLSMNGLLATWETLGGRLVNLVRGPAPPPAGAFVHLTPQDDGTHLFFPSVDGSLAGWECRTGRVEVVPAHDGPFYALLAYEDGLFSIGESDGRARFWSREERCVREEMSAPTGIVAGAVLPGLAPRFLLIDRSGRACIYERDKDALREVEVWSVQVFRSAAGPSSDEIRAVETALKRQEIERIIGELQAGEGRLSEPERAARHQRLVALGVEGASLELHGRDAHRQQETDPRQILVELRCRTRQQKLLPDTSEAVSPLLRYTDALEKVWLLRSVHEIRRRIARITQQQPSEELGRLAATVERLRKGEAVIELDTQAPFDLVLEAADIVGEALAGRYVVGYQASLPWPNSKIDSELVLAKYHKHVREVEREDLSRANLQTLMWISKQGSEERCCICVDKDQGPAPFLSVILSMTPEKGALPVFIALCAQEDGIESQDLQDVRSHNADVMRYFRQVRDLNSSNAWCRHVHEAIAQAVWQCANKADLRAPER